jgi:hypothetical protein
MGVSGSAGGGMVQVRAGSRVVDLLVVGSGLGIECWFNNFGTDSGSGSGWINVIRN